MLVIRMARAGTKKRPFYHIVVADSRSAARRAFHRAPRHFNPLLPKEKTERLKLDLEKVKAWMTKGAQPSDRVMRFLDAAGVMKRPKRNNPEKAVPRKERKAKEEAAKAEAAAQPAAAAAPRGRLADARDATADARVCLGQIGAPHGVRGEVRLRSFTAEPEASRVTGRSKPRTAGSWKSIRCGPPRIISWRCCRRRQIVTPPNGWRMSSFTCRASGCLRLPMPTSSIMPT